MRRVPADKWRLRAYVEYGQAVAAYKLLRSTFGANPPESIAHVMDALDGAIGRGPHRTSGSKYDALLEQSPITFDLEGLSPKSIKSGAHSWALYNGHSVATRTTPTGQVMVWLVSRNAR